MEGVFAGEPKDLMLLMLLSLKLEPAEPCLPPDGLPVQACLSNQKPCPLIILESTGMNTRYLVSCWSSLRPD